MPTDLPGRQIFDRGPYSGSTSPASLFAHDANASPTYQSNDDRLDRHLPAGASNSLDTTEAVSLRENSWDNVAVIQEVPAGTEVCAGPAKAGDS